MNFMYKNQQVMKKISSIILLIGLIWCANAQAPYHHSIGATLGNMNAVSYKTFFTDNIAFSVDAGFKWTLTSATYHEKQTGFVWHEAMIPMTIEVNPNVMYEGSTNVNGLHWLAGAGLSAGYAWSTYHDTWGTYKTYYGKLGVNAIGGVEYRFRFPLTLQADFRPGFGLLFNNHYNVTYFDWGLFVGARYIIQ